MVFDTKFYSCLMVWGASAKPLTLSRSAVFRNAGSWSWATFTSPAYINSKIAVRCWNGTSLRIMIGCLAGFSSRSALKYGEHAERTILCALHVCPSQANVTSVNDFSSRRCLKEETMFVWKSFQRRQNCCWSPACAILYSLVCDKLSHQKYWKWTDLVSLFHSITCSENVSGFRRKSSFLM